MVDSAVIERIDRVFGAQSMRKWKQKTSTLAHRRSLLERFRDSVIAHADDVAQALYEDMAKPAPEDGGYISEVQFVLEAIEDALTHLDEWAADVDLGESPTFPGARMTVRYEAKGASLIFGPWNFPFQLLLEPLAPAIAAGNTVILKPNEMTPATSRVVSRVFADFDEAEIAVFEGGVDVANALLERPFDHIFFTGSPTVGKIIMTAAAQHLASVTLELGGKCPAIVDRGVDIDAVADVVADGRQSNGGQICLATDYVLVPNELRDAFVSAYWRAIDRKFYDGGRFRDELLPRMIDERNAARVQGYLDDALARGASVPRGGLTAEGAFEPAVVLDAPPDAQVLREEIFGPVLPVLGYEDVEDVVGIVRRGTKPLAMYLYSHDEEFVEGVLRDTSSGGVTVNGWGSHWGEKTLPFGGVNHSGIGRYHGIHGFREFSHERSVLAHPGLPELVG